METKCHGSDEGSICGRDGCKGKIALHKPENCSCHINPPCFSCTDPRGYCPECDWQEKDDSEFLMNDFVVKANPQGLFTSYKPRELDNTKIDWRSGVHTNASMTKEGVYPEGTTRKQVEDAVQGTFGGRFEHFGNGKFKYIAYTD